MPNDRAAILNDKAVESLKDDALDFAPYVQALANICMTGSTPITIGVFGTWGSGKTSLMKMVKEQVEISGATAGWFDAWKYDKDETLWRAFLLSVLSAIRASTKEGQPTEDLDYLETMLYRAIDLEKSGNNITLDLAKLGGKLAQGAVQIGLSFIPGSAALSKIIEELQTTGITNLTEDTLDAIQRERSRVHIEQVRFLEQFQDKFRILVQQHVMNNGERLVIFVDDLDRCLPEKAIEVLEAIKLFVDAPGCIFVLGLDQEVIARGVELRYKEFTQNNNGVSENLINGAKYLEKIIQLPFQIPPVERTDMQDFVNGLSSNWPHSECSRVFAEGLGDNPRQIKRTVNVFLMLWSLAEKRKKKLQETVKPVRLAKVIAIQSIYPELYKIFQETPRYLRDLENYFRQDAGKRVQLEETNGAKNPNDAPNAVITVQLPPILQSYTLKMPLQRILTLHPKEMRDVNFNDISSDEINVYLAQLRLIEAHKSSGSALEFFEPQMVRISMGNFKMGTSFGQKEQILDNVESNEIERQIPQHTVYLPDYFIGKFPITNREYRSFVQDTRHKPPMDWNGENYPQGKGDCPVRYVSWYDTQEYCRWLSDKTGKLYRLPTEAEWEKASRGIDGSVYPWGNNSDECLCNVVESQISDTTPVGHFSPQGDSPYGCADMIGNVWEWCKDWFEEDEYKYRHDRQVNNPQGPLTGILVSIRGGSYQDNMQVVTCASRDGLSPSAKMDALGFRVAYSPAINKT